MNLLYKVKKIFLDSSGVYSAPIIKIILNNKGIIEFNIKLLEQSNYLTYLVIKRKKIIEN